MVARLLAVIALAAVAACGEVAKDPAEGLTFHAPAGWDSTPSLLGVHLYTSGAGNEFIVLESLPAGVNFDQVMEATTVRSPRDIARRNLTICKSTPARETTALVYFKNVYADMRLDLITAVRAGRTHVGAYLYPPDEAPDLRAEASIRMLCPRRADAAARN